MLEMVAKVLLTSVVVVAVAEASKRSVLLGAIIASLPLTSILAMVWLYADTGDADRIAGLAGGIFWLVLPSLILFVALPVLIHAGVGFWPSLLASAAATVAGYLAMLHALARFGITP